MKRPSYPARLLFICLWKPRYFFNEWLLRQPGKIQAQGKWRSSPEIHRAASDKFFPTADSRSARLRW
jgi:hypothetical protein